MFDVSLLEVSVSRGKHFGICGDQKHIVICERFKKEFGSIEWHGK
jgi:hypothetical protein